MTQVAKNGKERYDRGSDYEFSKVNDFSYIENSQVLADARNTSAYRSVQRQAEKAQENFNHSYSIEQEL